MLELNICLFLLGCIFDKPARPRATTPAEPSTNDDAGDELDEAEEPSA